MEQTLLHLTSRKSIDAMIWWRHSRLYAGRISNPRAVSLINPSAIGFSEYNSTNERSAKRRRERAERIRCGSEVVDKQDHEAEAVATKNDVRSEHNTVLYYPTFSCHFEMPLSLRSPPVGGYGWYSPRL